MLRSYLNRENALMHVIVVMVMIVIVAVMVVADRFSTDF